jgi:predicted alpha/beta-hydrolase family hydrolase
VKPAASLAATAHRFLATERCGEVSALLLRPEGARRLLVMAHGAGAGMTHRFMDDMALRLADRGIATLRYQFPYMEQGNRRPNPAPVLQATVAAAVAAAAEVAGDLPLLAGGKSMGGRMTSLAASRSALPGVQGLVFFGFPLHAAGKPSDERGRHLADVEVPMLFLQGTRDRLADLDLLRPVCDRLGARCTLRVLEQADHSFRVPRRSGIDQDGVLDELADAVLAWAPGVISGE